ncbi:heme exporter protein CcmD [Luteimonas sp. SX5]|uniref:Heme exporter protein D n=1 Tax=Luteimonas galliterrae TaxID=2940486 RepID=A0ABT0MHU7_9GAMM|nr:heme exporter protein CcmD [Luteimonas galliterrae]MCL1633829.1 heme exporter protein CcmD [Luteimonas galliterrae]
MSYQSYVIAAYSVFFAVLLWDFVAPRVSIRQLLKAAKTRAARQTRTDKNEPLTRES